MDLTACNDYWTRLGALPETIRALMDGDAEPYIAYWIDRTKGERMAAERRILYLQDMIADIATNGYDAERWRTAPRNFQCHQGLGPITVVRSGPHVFPRDGSHRASILKALGMPVIARVWRGA